MRLQQLEMFLVLIDTGSVRLTSEVVRMSQSAVSKSLKELEGMLQATLFERSPSGLTALPAARIFERYARQSVRSFNTMLTDLGREQDGVFRPVMLGCEGGIAQGLLNDVLLHAGQSSGKELVRVRVESNETLLQLLLCGDVEMALMYSSMHEPSPELRSFTVGLDRLVAVTSPRHPIFQGQALLHHFPWSMSQPACHLRGELEAAIRRRGLPWPPLIAEYQAMSVGFEQLRDNAIVWALFSLVSPLIQNGSLAMVDTPFSLPDVRLRCFRMGGRSLSPSALVVWRRLATWARHNAKALLPACAEGQG